MIRRSFAAVSLLILLSANSPDDPAAAFGARESVQSIRLSPDGGRIVYLSPGKGQGAGLYTVDLSTGQSLLTSAVDGERQRLAGCNFVANDRLVCTIFTLTDAAGEIVTVSRLVALDVDGSNVQVLGENDSVYQTAARLWGGEVVDWLVGDANAVLVSQYFVPEQRTGSNIERDSRGFGVVRLDTRNRKARTVEPPRLNASEYISDGRGKVRIFGMLRPRGETGMTGKVVNYFYRKPDSQSWERLSDHDMVTREGFNPVAVDADLNVAYGLDEVDGRLALFRVTLDGSLRREKVAAHPQVDVDSLIRIGRSGRVVGVSFATESRKAIFFDPEIKALANQLSQALPNLPLVRVVDASDDESRLLIWAGSDRDPGRYYTYDKGTRRLNEIMLARPQLEQVQLAEVKPVKYRASDGSEIPAYLTLPPAGAGRRLPALVMPHGGPSGRDEWGFDWLAQYFAHRDYAVLQPNFRGSEGYGDDFFQANGFQGWRMAVGDVVDAGRWLVTSGIADPARLGIFGWSYGGYAALQANVVDPGLFKAAVAVAPVTDLHLLKEEWRRWSSFRNISDFIGSGPHVDQGSPSLNAATIRAPVLLFHGELDRNVGLLQSRRMHEKLRAASRNSELVIFPGLDHQLEDSAARADMLRRSDAFFRKAFDAR